jgi:AbrB family looped-hinge helix DNA binding protein
METVIDKFGRVVIPKQVREDLGLKPGETLRVEERDQGILLKPLRDGSCLAYEGRVLVFTGEIVGDDTRFVRRHREERLRKLMRRRGR